MDRSGVVVIGSMNLDSFYQLPHELRVGENLHATAFSRACGGKGANQAVQCAKLGIRTRMVGCLGRDEHGDIIEKGMSGYGVDMRLVRRVDAPTGNAAVFVFPGGGVQAGLFGGANMRVSRAQIDEVLPILRQTASVVVQNEIAMDVTEYAIHRAKGAGCKVFYNAAPALPVSERALRAADVLIVNEAEASYYSGVFIHDEASAREGGRALMRTFGGDLVITLGSLGSLLISGNGERMIPAVPVEAVETTGAGDAYVGTLACGMLSGLPLPEAAWHASVAGAIAVSSVGAQPAMPTRAQLDQKLRSLAQTGFS